MMVKVLIRCKNVIDIVIMVRGVLSALRVLWVYGAPTFEKRKEVWKHIKRKARGSKDPLICVGTLMMFYMRKKKKREEKGKMKDGIFSRTDK